MPHLIPSRVLRNFEVTFLLSAFSSPGVHSASQRTEVNTTEFLGNKVQPVQRLDNSAILVVPDVKVRMEAKYSIPPLSLHDLLHESFTSCS